MLTLWNTYSFWVLYANAEGLDPRARTRGRNRRRTTSTDGRCPVCRGRSPTVIERMDAYDCTSAGRAIADYVEELSNWYVRLSRRRFWEGDRAAFATLRRCLLDTAALLAPFTPFIADEIHVQPHGRRGRVRRAAGLGPPARLPGARTRRWSTGARGGDGGGPSRRRARSCGTRAGRRSRFASRCAGRSSSPTTPSVRRSRARAEIVTVGAQRQGARLRQPRSPSS